ncbi:hypothetical protein Kpol_541p30 [Vanderwaltozyma polyspora DSM 70294]|uniref:Copper-fist domain-containing protein n=1 Tax=Vanderwaltozyma polyspora (strain ATCC 22028 / DSM 70294 / BCRC 21397 / CBS 2163 / NBRC 10782 / NRRL Y-8283 / UCD 57-17) TaxID=436907 RepID=A7TIX5_VANPO|nr:uncharacterized protein Kpol_541p30 [Vanderwaltozyma polyspora DSM 70294]EDO17787.1 hypothetical protein Kpol_541p30 [Vanderwaltozyma polyspora DSM 70294]
MVLINGVKYACERCIRGHRVTTCTHTDQPLMMIKPKGRPSTTCDLCKELRKNKKALINSPNAICTCGRLEKKRQQQKLKEEAKAKAKALAKEQKREKSRNGLISSSERKKKINSSNASSISNLSNMIKAEGRLSELSLLSGNGMLPTQHSFTNIHPNSSGYAFSDVSSTNSPPSSIDGRSNYGTNPIAMSRNISESSNFLPNASSFLDSGHNIASPTSGKITKDYHRVASIASLSSLHSQQSLEQSFSPQSPIHNSLNFVGGSSLNSNTISTNPLYASNNSESHINLSDLTSKQNLQRSKNELSISLDEFLPGDMDNSSPNWLNDTSLNNANIQSLNNSLNQVNQRQNHNNSLIHNNSYNSANSQSLDSGLLDTFMDPSSISGISKATYLLQDNNNKNGTDSKNDILNYFNETLNIGNNNMSKGQEILQGRGDLNDLSPDSNIVKNELDDLRSLNSVEVISLAPGSLDIPDPSFSSTFFDNRQDTQNSLPFNATSKESTNVNNNPVISLSEKQSMHQPTSPDALFSNLNESINYPSQSNSISYGNLKSNNNFNNTNSPYDTNIQTDLDQILLQTTIPTETDDLLNI